MFLSIPYDSIRKPLLTIPTLLQKISIYDPNSLPILWQQQMQMQMQMQMRWMTRHRRVQDRSKWKRVQPLENTTERWKLFSKILFLLELLKKQREQIITLRDLSRYRQKINLPKPFKISDFLKKSPRLFELYKDRKGLIWCGLTQEAEELMEEHEKLQKDHNRKLVEYVSRFLMMSVDKRIAIDKIAHFRRDLGLPDDFRKKWVREFPENFRVVEIDDVEYLELTSWNPEWAVTELEKRRIAAPEDTTEPPGIVSVPFPLKFPANYRRVWMFGKKIKRFQMTSYLSPYADPVGLIPGTSEFDKRAVAVMHELLSFTLEKRLVVDHLTHFRSEFVMPQRLMRLLLKHIGIFYVSEKGKRFNVFLTEAYRGSQLITKCPLVQWNEKLSRLAESRPREGIGEPIGDSNIPDESEILSSGTLNVDQENFLEFEGSEGDSQMNITEIEGVYASDEGMQLSFDMAVEPFQC